MRPKGTGPIIIIILAILLGLGFLYVSSQNINHGIPPIGTAAHDAIDMTNPDNLKLLTGLLAKLESKEGSKHVTPAVSTVPIPAVPTSSSSVPIPPIPPIPPVPAVPSSIPSSIPVGPSLTDSSLQVETPEQQRDRLTYAMAETRIADPMPVGVGSDIREYTKMQLAASRLPLGSDAELADTEAAILGGPGGKAVVSFPNYYTPGVDSANFFNDIGDSVPKRDPEEIFRATNELASLAVPDAQGLPGTSAPSTAFVLRDGSISAHLGSTDVDKALMVTPDEHIACRSFATADPGLRRRMMAEEEMRAASIADMQIPSIELGYFSRAAEASQDMQDAAQTGYQHMFDKESARIGPTDATSRTYDESFLML